MATVFLALSLTGAALSLALLLGRVGALENRVRYLEDECRDLRWSLSRLREAAEAAPRTDIVPPPSPGPVGLYRPYPMVDYVEMFDTDHEER